MKKNIVSLLSARYSRYHDLVFYVLALAVILLCAVLAVHITRHKNALEREHLQTRDIPQQEFTVGEKPIMWLCRKPGCLTNKLPK